MSLLIQSRPDKSFPISGKTSRWLAVNGDYPVLINILRRDTIGVLYQRLNGDLLEIITLNGDFSSELVVGDQIYVHSEAFSYIDGSYTIAQISSTGSGGSRITTVEQIAGSWSSDFDANNYVNAISSRLDHRVTVRVTDSILLRDIFEADYVGFSSGLIQLDLASIAKLPLEVSHDFSNVNEKNNQTSIRFYLTFTEKYGAFVEETIDSVNYHAVSGAMQLQEDNAPNLLDFVAFNADLDESEKAQFLTDFEKPVYFQGYPFKLGFIFESEGADPVLTRNEETFDSDLASVGTSSVGFSSNDYRYMNFLTNVGSYADTVKEFDIWIESDLGTGDTCSLVDASDLKYQEWLTDSSNVTGIYVEPNTPASDISSIDSRPNGTLYRDEVSVATLIYNATLGYYEPDVAVLFTGTLRAEVLSIDVTTNALQACTVDFNQTLEAAFAPPIASNVTLTVDGGGILVEGSGLTGSYTFTDQDGDAEGASIISIRRYDSEALANADTNGTGGTEVSTSLTHTVAAGQEGKYFRLWVTPVSVAAPTTGDPAASTNLGPVLAPLATFQTNKQTDFTLGLFFADGTDYTIDWGDSNVEAFTGSTTLLNRTHSYGSAGTYDVTLYGSSSDLSRITSITQGLISVDISDCAHLSQFDLSSNASLATLTLPTTQSVNIIDWNASESALTSALTFPTATLSDGALEFQGNTGLPSIDISNLSGTFTVIRFDRTNITALTFPAGLNANNTLTTNTITAYTCPLLTSCNISSVTGKLNTIHIYSSALTGVIDFGSIEFTNANVRFDSNSGVTGWDISSCTGDLNQWRWDSCGLSGTQIINLPFDGTLTNNLIYTYSCSTSDYDLDISGSSGNMNGIRIHQSRYVGTLTDPGFVWTGNGIFTANNLTTNGLTGIDLSAASGTMNFFDLGDNSNLVGAIDLTGFSWTGVCVFRVDNTGVTSIDHTGTSSTATGFSQYIVSGSNITGAHALGTFVFRAESTILIRNNSLMTSLDLSNCSGDVKWIQVDGCNISGTIDITGLNLSLTDGQLLAFDNSGFTGWVCSASMTGNLTVFQAYSTSIVLQTNNYGNVTLDETCSFEFFDCGLAAADVDNWWIELDNMNPHASGASGSLEGGGTNDAPTATSSTARTNLTNAGFTLSI